RLGIAQCDVALGHADHRAFDFAGARARALAARASFRELHNPRGEAAYEQLLQDPWGELESRLLLAQVALARDDGKAEALVAACDRVKLDEAEPRQHRHLTRAWLANLQGRWEDAASEVDAARAVFVSSSPEGGGVRAAEARARTGDHTPHLLRRLAQLEWGDGAALATIESWMQQIEAAGGRAPSSEYPALRRA